MNFVTTHHLGNCCAGSGDDVEALEELDQRLSPAGTSRRAVLRGAALGAVAAGSLGAAPRLLFSGAAAAATLRNGTWTNPTRGRRTSAYGWRTLNGQRTFHAGWDLANPTGTAIYAAAAGTVVKRGTNIISGRTGNAIMLQHSGGYYTYYGHLNLFRVSLGAKVGAGALIADMGATGNVTGPHLHFEVHSGSIGNTVDPLPFVTARGVVLGGGYCTLDPNANGERVKAMQYLLRHRNYSIVVDGNHGPDSTATLKSFQKSSGLYVDGQCGPKSWEKLVATVRAGSSGDAVRAAQVLLNTHSAGLLVDGDFGSVSTSAVKSFQSRNQLSADGEVGPITWTALAG